MCLIRSFETIEVFRVQGGALFSAGFQLYYSISLLEESVSLGF